MMRSSTRQATCCREACLVSCVRPPCPAKKSTHAHMRHVSCHARMHACVVLCCAGRALVAWLWWCRGVRALSVVECAHVRTCVRAVCSGCYDGSEWCCHAWSRWWVLWTGQTRVRVTLLCVPPWHSKQAGQAPTHNNPAHAS